MHMWGVGKIEKDREYGSIYTTLIGLIVCENVLLYSACYIVIELSHFIIHAIIFI